MSHARTEPEPAALLAGLLEGIALHVALHVVPDPEWDGPNHVVLVRLDDHHVTIAVRPLEGDLAVALSMLEVAEEWPIVGVAAVGWARAIDQHGAIGERGGRVRSVVLVHRSGLTASVLHRQGQVAEVLSEPVEGRVVDALRNLLARGARKPERDVGG